MSHQEEPVTPLILQSEGLWTPIPDLVKPHTHCLDDLLSWPRAVVDPALAFASEESDHG